MFHRSELLLGSEVMMHLSTAKVILFGVGGVGSWCAESLVRTGLKHLTLVDVDCVSLTNCNRQLMATSQTLGQPKVIALKERLLAINPDAIIDAQQRIYEASTADSFHLETFDFVIDAIDSLTDKAQLILHATSLPKHVTFFSSMGAALRIDPLKVRQTEFWNIKGDGLARALRNKFKKQQTFPKRKFICVYSEEVPLPNLGVDLGPDTPGSQCPPKAQINGSLCPVTGVFGMTLAGLVIQTLYKSALPTKKD